MNKTKTLSELGFYNKRLSEVVPQSKDYYEIVDMIKTLKAELKVIEILEANK